MDLKTYQRDCLLGTLGAVLMLIGDLCLSIRRQRTICQRGISEWIVGRMAAAAATGHRAFRYGAGLFYRKGFLRADTSAVPKDPVGAPHRRRDLHSLRRGGAFFHRQSCGLDGEACADTWPRRNGCRDTGPVPATDAAAAYRLRGNDLAYPYELFCPADEENRLAAANACVAYVGLADRVCADPGYTAAVGRGNFNLGFCPEPGIGQRGAGDMDGGQRALGCPAEKRARQRNKLQRFR